ncbi:MAG: hypothetical protein AAGD38_15230 [Acidobacteriota bacterium]
MNLINLGNASVKGDAIEYSEQGVMDFEIKSEVGGETVSGTLGASEYTSVTPAGSSPWTVKMGSSNFSRSATASGITAADASVSCLIAFPIPPNDAHLFVDTRKS